MDTVIQASVFAASAAVTCGLAFAFATYAAIQVFESLKSFAAQARLRERPAGLGRF